MEFGTVSNSTLLGFAIEGVVTLLLPVILTVFWTVKMKAKVTPVFVGAVIFVFFAMILEGIPKMILLVPGKPLADFIISIPLLYAIIGAALAGIFEECGRWVAFRFVLKNYKDKKNAVTYGIGHGGVECMLLVGINAISTIALALMINNGTYSDLLVGMNEEQVQGMITTAEAITGTSFWLCMVGTLERVVAIAAHIAFSVIVFVSVQREGFSHYFPIAILLHAGLDMWAALYQIGWLPIWLCEILVILTTIAICVYAYRIYKRADDGLEQKKTIEVTPIFRE